MYLQIFWWQVSPIFNFIMTNLLLFRVVKSHGGTLFYDCLLQGGKQLYLCRQVCRQVSWEWKDLGEDGYTNTWNKVGLREDSPIWVLYMHIYIYIYCRWFRIGETGPKTSLWSLCLVCVWYMIWNIDYIFDVEYYNVYVWYIYTYKVYIYIHIHSFYATLSDWELTRRFFFNESLTVRLAPNGSQRFCHWLLAAMFSVPGQD